jgi:hypothetical protein
VQTHLTYPDVYIPRCYLQIKRTFKIHKWVTGNYH